MPINAYKQKEKKFTIRPRPESHLPTMHLKFVITVRRTIYTGFNWKKRFFLCKQGESWSSASYCANISVNEFVKLFQRRGISILVWKKLLHSLVYANIFPFFKFLCSWPSYIINMVQRVKETAKAWVHQHYLIGTSNLAK